MKERLDLEGNAVAYAKAAKKAIEEVASALAKANKAQASGAMGGGSKARSRGTSAETAARRDRSARLKVGRDVARFQKRQASDAVQLEKRTLRQRFAAEKAAARSSLSLARQTARQKAGMARANRAGKKQGDANSAALWSAGGMAAGAGAAVGAAALGAGAFVGKLVYDAAAFKQSTMFAYKNLLGSQGAAEDAWAMAKKTSMTLGIGLQESAGSLNSLLAQGFKLGDADTLIKQMADLKAINPAANLEGIVRAITQIKATGRLQGDELMQLTEAGLASSKVYEELSKSLNVPIEKISQLQSAGKITADQAIAAIQASISKQTGKDPGALAAEMANSTLTGAMGRLNAAKDSLIDSVSLDFGPLMTFVDKISAAMSGEGGTKLVASVERLFQAGLDGLNKFSADDLGSMFGAVADSVDKFATAVGQASAAAKFLMDAMNALGGVSNWLSFGLAAVSGPLGQLWNVAINASTGIDAVFTSMTGLAESAFASGAAIVDGIVVGIMSAPEKVADALRSVVQSGIDAVDKLLKVGSPSKLMAERGAWSTEGLAIGQQKKKRSLIESTKDLVESSLGGMGSTRQGIESRADHAQQTFQTAINGMVNPSSGGVTKAPGASSNSSTVNNNQRTSSTSMGDMHITVPNGAGGMSPQEFARMFHAEFSRLAVRG